MPDDRREDIRIVRRGLGEQGLFMFHETYLRHYKRDPTTHEVTESGKFHVDMCYWLDEAIKPKGKLVGAVPRGHAKTTFGTIGNVCRMVCQRKKRNIILIAAKQQEANNKLRDIIHELETNTRLKEDYGDDIKPLLDDSGKPVTYKDAEVIFSNGVRVAAMQILGKIRGQIHQGVRPDCLIFDDPEDDESVESPEQRKKLWRWLTTACLNSMDHKTGSLIWLGTILHHDSILSKLINEMPWPKFKYPAILEFGTPEFERYGQLLWPVRWTMPELMEIKARDPAAFAQEFMNMPLDPADQVFKPEHWKFYHPEDLRIEHGAWQIAGADGSADLLTYMGVDPAISQSKRSDYFAIVVLGVSQRTGDIYMLENYRGKISFDEQITLIKELSDRWKCQRVFIEAQGYQAALEQKAWNIGVPCEPIKHSTGKDARIRAGALHIQRGRVFLPKPSDAARSFMTEAEYYPKSDHDDQLDAYTICVQNCLNAGRGGVWTADKKRQAPRLLKDLESDGGRAMRWER